MTVLPESVAAPVVARIDRIAAGGAGVGRLPDGRAVFVHRTAPGDLAEVRVEPGGPRWMRGRLVRLHEEGDGRRAAPCPYYERCGGCTLEHLEPAAQLQARAHIVADALQRIGHVDIDLPEVVPSPAEFRYRNRVTFTLARTGRRVIAGFHELERPGHIVDLDARCLLLEPALAEAWSALRQAWGPHAQALPAGPRLRLTLRTAAGGASLLIEGGTGRGQPEALLHSLPQLRSVWHRRAPGERVRLLAGEETLDENWGGDPVSLRGAVFLQVNRAAAALLEAHVLERIGSVKGLHVIDAYSGVGLYTRRLVNAGASVTAIERDSDAARSAAQAAPSARVLTGAVERHLPSALPADLVILNPPRSGLHADVCATLSASRTERIIYISCDPATLARDVQRLSPSHRVSGVRCFDLFPQTAHVETVLELACATT